MPHCRASQAHRCRLATMPTSICSSSISTLCSTRAACRRPSSAASPSVGSSPCDMRPGAANRVRGVDSRVDARSALEVEPSQSALCGVANAEQPDVRARRRPARMARAAACCIPSPRARLSACVQTGWRVARAPAVPRRMGHRARSGGPARISKPIVPASRCRRSS